MVADRGYRPTLALVIMSASLCSSLIHSRHEDAANLHLHANASPDLPRSQSNEVPCQTHNANLNAWLKQHLKESEAHLLPSQAKDLGEFAKEVKVALEANVLEDRPIHALFSNTGSPLKELHPTCAGDWLEFGVASGGTVNLAAKFRQDTCSPACPSVFGFDTFTGLPEQWIRDDAHTWHQREFDQSVNEGGYPPVEPNVYLIKGLFNESIPPWLTAKNAYAGQGDVISYLHVDCDLYAGTRDIFTLLGPRIKVGTIIVFDDLINYQYFLDHEIKALWEWLQSSGSKLLPLGVLGPLPDKDYAVELDTASLAGDAAPWFHQSAAFIVAQQPS